MNEENNNEKSQFGLLTIKRFAPFFWTQFFGAFNDNVYKNALIILIAYKYSQILSGSTDIWINSAAGLFILPFFIFSATAGQIADKYDKSFLIKIIKLMEIVIMTSAAVAFYFDSLIALMLILFFMGAQSTFFGPIKYSIIPQHLKTGEIVGGNAMVEMGTFVSILLGTITGGVLVQMENGTIFVSIIVCLIATLGWTTSLFIPSAPSTSPNIKISLNPFSQTYQTVKFVCKERIIFLTVLGISWYWALGVSYLTQIPNYAKNVLHGSEGIVTLLLTMFSVGVGIGSLLCEWLSGKRIEYGIVPIGSLGLSIFGIDLVFAYSPPNIDYLMGIGEFLKTPGSIRVLLDLILIGLFGGFYIVPLYSILQIRSSPEFRARIIAGNNIWNSLFMVLAAAFAGVLIGIMGLTIPQFFFVLVVLNILIAVYIYTIIPEFTMRCLIWLLTHIMYRIKHKNLQLIPKEGPAVLVCNHVSYVDGLIIAGACRSPARFVIDKEIFNIPVLSFIFKTGKAIPITSRHRDPETYENAFTEISKALSENDIVCIFPEGKLTVDGNINEFKTGIERIIQTNPVPVIPMALIGLWGSFFSHKGGRAFTRLPKRFFSKIKLIVGEPVMPENVSAKNLQEIVENLVANNE
ncbi:MAG: MFS transporter [Desulfobacterales bacterium]|nr:MFS transporter [Desulfobacterales bacterium]